MTKRYPLHHEDAQPMYVNVLREEYETLKRKAREYDRITSENDFEKRILEFINTMTRRKT